MTKKSKELSLLGDEQVVEKKPKRSVRKVAPKKAVKPILKRDEEVIDIDPEVLAEEPKKSPKKSKAVADAAKKLKAKSKAEVAVEKAPKPTRKTARGNAKSTRASEEVVENILDEIVPRYYENNELKKTYTKLAADDNKIIKESMLTMGLEEFEVDGIKATVSERTSTGYDQEVLLATLKELNIPDVIKTREYVDMTALEAAIAGGEVTPEDLVATIKTSTTNALTIKKV